MTPFDRNNPATARGLGHLLDIAPEFGRDLPAGAFAAARRVVLLPVFDVPIGFDLMRFADPQNRHGRASGLYVADGFFLSEIKLQQRTSGRILGQRDLVFFDGTDYESLPTEPTHVAQAPSRVVLFDGRWLEALARYPSLFVGLSSRAAVQANRGMRFQAISQLPRVEDRLLAALWNAADLLGHVRRDGVLVELDLSHHTLGRLIGAQRPTVSLGVQALTRSGRAKRVETGWLLSLESLDQFNDDPHRQSWVDRGTAELESS